MKTLAIVRVYARSWWALLWLGGPLLLLAVTGIPQRDSDERLQVAVIGPWLLLACYGLPLRLLALGASRRLMPGHAQAVTRILAVCAGVGGLLGLAMSLRLGAPPPAAAVCVVVSAALGWSVLALCDSGWRMLGALTLCAVWVFIVVPRAGLQLGRPEVALPMLVLALWASVRGWRRLAKPAAFDEEPVPMGLDAAQSSPTPPPAWLAGGSHGQRRLGIQLWSPTALAAISALWVLLWSATGYLISRLSQDGTEMTMLRTCADVSAGWLLIAANGLIVGGTDAGRRQLALLFRLPGGGRRRIVRRLIDRGLASALEVTCACAVGGGSAWVAMDLIFGRMSADTVVRSLGIVFLAVLVGLSTSAFSFWVITWRMPSWLSWLLGSWAWCAIVLVGCLGLSGWRHRGTAADQMPAYLAAAIILLAIGAITRHLAIRRLAVAEPG